MLKKIKDFFFQDDTKIKIECETRTFWDTSKKKLVVRRKFYTLRSISNFVWWYITKNPYEKSKKYLEVIQKQPEYSFQLVGYFLLFFIGALLDIKNISHITLVAGAIAFDATANATNQGSTPSSFAHTCTGTNLVLAVSVASYRGPSSCSYNSVAMTLGVSASLGQAKTGVYYLANPSTGSNTVSFTATSSGMDDICAISFSGADTSSPTGITGTNTTTNSNTISQSVTTTRANSFLVDAVATEDDSTHVYGPDAGQTQRMWGQSDFWIGGGASTKPTTSISSYTMGWTLSSGAQANNLSISIIEVKEFVATSTGGVHPTLLTLGVG